MMLRLLRTATLILPFVLITIAKIAEAIDDKCYEDAYGDATLDDYDGSIWQVRELGEPFKIELSISRKIGGKRC